MSLLQSNLAQRLATAVVAVPLLAWLVFLGPAWSFYALALTVTILGARELFQMTHPEDVVSQAIGVLLASCVSAVLYLGSGDLRVVLTLLVVSPTLGALVTLLRLKDISSAARRAMSMSAGPLLIGIPMTLLALIKKGAASSAPGWLMAAFGFAWIADTGGYFAGRFLGKHKLYEAVSPKKTVEGAVGALLANVLAAFGLHLTLLKEVSFVYLAALGLVAGVFGIAGDLSESLLKRSVGVKDSGNIIPGHGGVLDRIDALMFTSAVVFVARLWSTPDACPFSL